MTKRPLYSELRTLYETTAQNPNTFRLTIRLKHFIDGERLRIAVDRAMARYPYFKVRLCAEGGRLCFEENPAPIPVFHTDQRTVLGGTQAANHLIAFCYWEDRLFIDVYHGLTDGGGIGPFLKSLLYYYCSDCFDPSL